jgi:hypothetical protein
MSRWKWRASTGWFSTCTYRNLDQHSGFLGLCALADHPPPAALDPENQFFTFAAGVAKLGGGNGWIDVWFKDSLQRTTGLARRLALNLARAG